MSHKVESFRKQNPKFYLLGLIFGSYPPGSDKNLGSRPLQWLFYSIGLFPSLGSFAYASGIMWHIFNSPSLNAVVTIRLIRRAIIMYFLGARISIHLFRYKKTDKIFQEWEENINVDYCANERKKLLKQNIKSSTIRTSIGLATRSTMAVLYNIPFILHRYAPSSELAGFPHDNTSPSHFYYVGFQLALFMAVNFALPTIDLYTIYLYTMAQTELKILREKLGEILSTLDTNEENEILFRSSKGLVRITKEDECYKTTSKQVYNELKIWARKHLAVIKFMDNFAVYSQPDVSLKYIYLAVHCSLVIIGLSGMTTSAMVNDFLLTVLVTISNFWVLFYTTRKIDAVTEESNKIFIDGYSKCWFLYPLKVQKTLRLISKGIANINYKIKLFKIYKDNSEGIMSVLQLAGQALTFVVTVTNI